MANYDLTYEGSRVQGILDTGNSLKDAGYIFRGEATPSTVPGTPTERVAYIGGPGTYTNFGSSITVPVGRICVFKYTGSAWSNQVIDTKVSDGAGYKGIATPTTNPGSPIGSEFYIAVQAGTYTNFGNLAVTDGINILKYNGSAWSVDQVIAIDAEPTQGSDHLVKSGGVLKSIIQNGPAFDLSAYNAVGGTLATYADLSAALTALNALPADFKKGGMSFKFVQTSDNKYVQYRYVGTTVTGNPNPFLNPALWQQIDEIKELQKVGINSSNELFDRSTTLFGVDLKSTNGEETPSNSWNCSPFIQMDAYTVLYVEAYDRIVFCYDSEKNYIGRLPNVWGRTISSISSSFTNTAFIRIIFSNSMITTARIGLSEKENLVKDYFDYDNTPQLGSDALVLSEPILNCINDKIATLRAMGFDDLKLLYKSDKTVVTINDNFNRLTLIGKVSAGSSFSFLFNELLKHHALRCYVCVFATYDLALKDSSADLALQNISGGWKTTNIDAIINYDGYILIDIDNQNSSNYTIRESEDVVRNLNIVIDKKTDNSYYLNSWVKGDWSNGTNGPYLTARQYKIRNANWLFLKKGTIIEGFFISTGQTAHVDIWDATTGTAIDVNTNRTSNFKVTLAQDSKVLVWTSSAVQNPTNTDITINVRITEQSPMNVNKVTKLRIATFNTGDYTFANSSIVKGSDDARTKFREVVAEIDADIIATQEDVPFFNDTDKSLPRDEVFGMFKYGYRPGIVFGWNLTPEINPNYHGFYSTLKLDNVRGEWYNLTPEQAPLLGHYMFAVAELHIDGKVIVFVNVHYDWSDKNARALQVQKIISFCSQYKYAIIIGDFNPENRIAQYNSSTGQYESVVQMPKYIYEDEWQVYKDAGYIMANGGYFGTFNTCEDNGGWHPYDNIICSPNIAINKAWIVEKNYMNDHKPVIAEIIIY